MVCMVIKVMDGDGERGSSKLKEEEHLITQSCVVQVINELLNL